MNRLSDLLYRLNQDRLARAQQRRDQAAEARHLQDCTACRDGADARLHGKRPSPR